MVLRNHLGPLSLEVTQQDIFTRLGDLLTELNGKLEAGQSINVSNLPATQTVSGTISVVEPVTTDGSYDERYSGGKSAYATTVAAAGDTVLVTPAVGMRLRLVWASAIPSPDATSANRIRFQFGAGLPLYESYALAHWEVFDGPVDTPLILNTANAEPVSVTVHYREIA